MLASHYSDEEITLDNICEMLGVSNSYFSTVFKKETGNSFIGYLTEYRMERASRMLIETNEKSYIIAKNVGYTDPNYFSYVFKRRFGVPLPNTEWSTAHVKNKYFRNFKIFRPRGIHYTIMLVFFVISISIMLILGIVMYSRFSALSRENTIHSTEKLMEQAGESWRIIW